ncbi:hypothetical protein VPH35_032708 [Triticum aestivum]|uniref:Uncharacterized protein n=1 Tax=Triticum turgidum subsp. durum TaxID=4567 RepID=A0A9R1Q2Y4_TRITD|nr:uncharacterized protein LOC123042691 isoform X2 [Triticum aestivum]VAH54194.1 unnamed protein product [Triticum turgidum subsp. durum]
MAMAEAESNGFEFLSDPVNRFPPMDLSHDNSLDYDEGAEVLIRARSDSSMRDAGDAALTVVADLNSTCEAIALTVAPSETSTGRDDPHAPGWTRRVRVGRAPTERPPCAGRTTGNEKTPTVIVPVVGSTFDYYNLYSWETGFEISYGKSRLNVEWIEQNACRR